MKHEHNILFNGNVDGYDVRIETTEEYYRGDDDLPSAAIFVKGKGISRKSPIWGLPPKVVTDGMVRQFLREEGL